MLHPLSSFVDTPCFSFGVDIFYAFYCLLNNTDEVLGKMFLKFATRIAVYSLAR